MSAIGRELSLPANAAWMLAGTGVYAASQWGVGVVLARGGGPTAVGLFTLASAIAAPAVSLSQLALRQVMVADVAGRYAFSDYFRLRLGLTVGAFMVILAVMGLLGYRGAPMATMALVALGRCCESVSDIYFGRLQRAHRLDRVAHYLILRGVLCLSAVAPVFGATHSLVLAGAAFAASCAGALVVLHWRQWADGALAAVQRRTRGRRRLYLASLTARAAPLAIAQMFIALNAYVPRYALDRSGGPALVGQYAAIEYFIAIGGLMVTSLGQAASPRLSEFFQAGKTEAFVRLAAAICAACAGLGVVAAILTQLIGRQVMLITYGPAFSQAAGAFAPIVLAGSLGYVASAMGYVVTSTGRFKGLTWRYAAVFIASLAIATVAIPRLGLLGAAVVLAGGGLVNNLVSLGALPRFKPARNSSPAAPAPLTGPIALERRSR